MVSAAQAALRRAEDFFRDHQCSGFIIGFFFVGTRGGNCAASSSASRMYRRIQCAWRSNDALIDRAPPESGGRTGVITPSVM